MRSCPRYTTADPHRVADSSDIYYQISHFFLILTRRLHTLLLLLERIER